MPVFSKNNKNILFIHIPKSAGSSIEQFGVDSGWIESFSVQGKSLRELKFYKCTPQHLHNEPLQYIFNLHEFDSIFTVVRNPFSRLKSEYYWQYSKKITALDVDEWVAHTFDQYEHNSYCHDNHIRPQVEFIPTCKKVEIFKLEEGGVQKAENVFLRLSEKSSKFTSWKNRYFSKPIQSTHKKASIKDTRIESTFNKHYNRIIEFYRKDFDYFAYDY
ncbi:sulfotransferase family 2 domain-containing protein [Desulfoplanes sp. PS50]